MQYPILPLKKGEDRRLRQGHLWVFSNEVDTRRTPLSTYQPGDLAVVVDHGGQPLGLAYVNPHALICARLYSRDPQRALDTRLLEERLQQALSLRERCHEHPYYRWVFGESDGLPGLVLDRYGDTVVGQIATCGMERRKAAIAQAVAATLAPRSFIWKNSGGFRDLEQLPRYQEAAWGPWPEALHIEEAGLRFTVDPQHAQKTGWFYDQRRNRDALAPLLRRGGSVLDLFSYAGAWGVRAAACGAHTVTCIDSSAHAVAAIERNARQNGFAHTVSAIQEDAFDALKRLRAEHRSFDTVIVDPPAFIKRKKDFAQGRLAYRRLNEMAMQILAPGGILVSCSCSQALPREALIESLQQGARRQGRQLQLLIHLHQGPDHPILPAVPETEYLKGSATCLQDV